MDHPNTEKIYMLKHMFMNKELRGQLKQEKCLKVNVKHFLWIYDPVHTLNNQYITYECPKGTYEKIDHDKKNTKFYSNVSFEDEIKNEEDKELKRIECVIKQKEQLEDKKKWFLF